MDGLLREIQVELSPDRQPAPALDSAPEPDPAPAPEPRLMPDSEPAAATLPHDAPAPTPDPHIQTHVELSARLLASMRELLAGYERVLVGRAAPPAARRPARRRPDTPDVTLSAAPFPSLEALHEFEAAVARLQGVRGVAVQGYEGTDRAIIEVRLDPPR
jgi:hypothetical protein